jgi:hypothetical protein
MRQQLQLPHCPITSRVYVQARGLKMAILRASWMFAVAVLLHGACIDGQVRWQHLERVRGQIVCTNQTVQNCAN